MRYLFCAVSLTLAAGTGIAQPPAWVTIQGQVVFPAAIPIPVQKPLVIGGGNAPACLAKGPILDEAVIVNPKNRGIKNVVVWLRPNNVLPKAAFAPNEIHPADAKRKPADAVIDQPCCMFVDRVLACRVGDTIVVKNPAAFPHNFFWTSANNGEFNLNLPPKAKHTFAIPLVPEPSPIQYKCTVHPWMTGYVRIFDHPYYAVTDTDGKFEIKDAPAGDYRIVYWHENVGFLNGKNGRFGAPIAIAGGAKNSMEMKPTDFDVK